MQSPTDALRVAEFHLRNCFQWKGFSQENLKEETDYFWKVIDKLHR